MKDGQEKIDLLLARNADEQLKNVDWGKLNEAISNRLDKAQQSKTSTIRFPIMFKIAAGIAVAAAVMLMTLMIKPERPADVQSGDGRAATVKFIDSKGSASVVIIEPPDRVHVKVDIAGKSERLKECYVKIIDSRAGQKEDINRPSWFIICMSEPVYVNNDINRDVLDVLYLF